MAETKTQVTFEESTDSPKQRGYQRQPDLPESVALAEAVRSGKQIAVKGKDADKVRRQAKRILDEDYGIKLRSFTNPAGDMVSYCKANGQ